MKDLSVVMPYYKRIAEFDYAFTRNYEFLKDFEVVLVLDEPTEQQQVLEFIKHYDMKWKVIVNPNDHEWRNPSKAINVGIRHATASKIMVMSPETILRTKVDPFITMLHAKSYGVGFIAFTTFHQVCYELEVADKLPRMPFGTFCCSKAILESIQGYDESNTTWGADDNNIRARLKLAGIRRVEFKGIKALHPVHGQAEAVPITHEKWHQKTQEERMRYVYPKSAIANEDRHDSWGRDFYHLIYQT